MASRSGLFLFIAYFGAFHFGHCFNHADNWNPDGDGTGTPHPVPGFGTQLFDKAIFGVQSEGEFIVTYSERSGMFKDGEVFSLREPHYEIVQTYRAMPAGVLISPRVAPPVFGRGLLEATDEMTIFALADESDSDGDGISGKPNFVWDYQKGLWIEVEKPGKKSAICNSARNASKRKSDSIPLPRQRMNTHSRKRRLCG